MSAEFFIFFLMQKVITFETNLKCFIDLVYFSSIHIFPETFLIPSLNKAKAEGLNQISKICV